MEKFDIDRQHFNLKDVKYMRYLDYKLNNTPALMKRYPGVRFPRLVEYIVSHQDYGRALFKDEAMAKGRKIYKILWTEGLFHSCQA
ncbi:hypothetical protein [Acetilactobacillus jinshanensis]|uniref:Uncharacterized protein n=1 Tax=Acetilactobacillus jinshanensis TaxID=1720083 RepID=A0A4V1ALM0_9LACO|nr:hypothetical protein [Acetilactobacillus jinshanensis]QBP18069.1 hypothetical protein ELX58_02675 [Acetilactobacillus jinshanensis]URL60932.1 hypothetical protein HGK75_02715 [uncultured bacterium]